MFLWASVHVLKKERRAPCHSRSRSLLCVSGLRKPTGSRGSTGRSTHDQAVLSVLLAGPLTIRPSSPCSTSTHVVRPHGVDALSSRVVWSPVWEREPTGNHSSTVVKFPLKLLLQLQHLWGVTASGSWTLTEKTSKCLSALQRPWECTRHITSGTNTYQAIHEHKKTHY